MSLFNGVNGSFTAQVLTGNCFNMPRRQVYNTVFAPQPRQITRNNNK